MPKIACDGLKSKEKGRKKEPSGLKSSRGKKGVEIVYLCLQQCEGGSCDRQISKEGDTMMH